jgi:hypothetical protein
MALAVLLRPDSELGIRGRRRKLVDSAKPVVPFDC